MPAYRNQFPLTDPGAMRLALVGESLGANELAQGRPFCGAAGQALDRQLAKVGLLRNRIFIGNVCAIQPPRNEFDALAWDGADVQDGIATLLADLAQFHPNLVLTMGNVPLHLFSIGNVTPPSRKRGSKRHYDWPRKVTVWRGSLFESSQRTLPQLTDELNPVVPDAPRWKCLATVHPAFCLRSWGEWFNFQADLRRAVTEASSPALNLPAMDFQWGPQ